jgi:formylglycine-generating enzyme required for sulfatase activity
MHGNIPEWCVDWHMADYYQRSPKENPIELDQGIAQGRVLRGGSYSDLPEIIRSAARSYQTPNRGDFTNGFRVSIVGNLKLPVKQTRAEGEGAP